MSMKGLPKESLITKIEHSKGGMAAAYANPVILGNIFVRYGKGNLIPVRARAPLDVEFVGPRARPRYTWKGQRLKLLKGSRRDFIIL